MHGKYTVEIYNNKLHYQIDIKRNITIIQGNSATGKTTLINMIEDYVRLGNGSGITLNCEKKCVVLPAIMWQGFIKETSDSIIFVEENLPFIKSAEFAEAVNYSDNYFVIVYRDSLPQLAYSIEEIYGLREDRDTQRYVNPKLVYQSTYNIYNMEQIQDIYPDVVITEDSNSGYDFFSTAFTNKCVASEGKSKVHSLMSKYASEDMKVLGIVDGAAFGADMQKMMKTISTKRNQCFLYAPESFEYLLLKAGVVDCPSTYLDNTYDFADSCKYASWEQFYTKKIHELTSDSNHRYTKKHLNNYYLSERNIKKVQKLMNKIKFNKEE